MHNEQRTPRSAPPRSAPPRPCCNILLLLTSFAALRLDPKLGQQAGRGLAEGALQRVVPRRALPPPPVQR